MSLLMQHFLVTRFNVKSHNWKVTKKGSIANDEDWLIKRFELFEQLCLPSVKNQSNQNFKWILIFDRNTPTKYIERINNLKMSYLNLMLLVTDSFDTLKIDLIEFITNSINSKNTYIITTRLDNDDILHNEFINCIQHLFVPKRNTIIDLTKGYQIKIINNQYDARLYNTLYTPFISLIEYSSSFETVMAHNHNQWRQLKHPIFFNEAPYWIQLIHEENLVNSQLSYLKKVSQIDLRAFGLSNLESKSNISSAFVFNLLTWPMRCAIAITNKIKYLVKVIYQK